MDMGDYRPATPSSRVLHLYGKSPALFCYCATALVMIALRSLGFRLDGDMDDYIKLYEVRTFLETGNIFDRTLPGIVQPEPYISHWPWIVDLPYAAFAWLLAPFLGAEPALAAASFVVPVLLFAPALYLYRRLMIAVDIGSPAVALPLGLILASSTFCEYAPERIDYHNLQILLLLAALVLLLSQKRAAPLINGLLTALAFAISAEFAPFYALLMAVYAFDWITDREQGAARLTGFGLSLAMGAIALLAAVQPPSAYAAVKCDTYSAPYATALVAAGLSFAVSPLLAGRRSRWAMRATILAVFAAASVATLTMLFPQCLHGPYASIDAYVRDNMLNRILQEMSLFRHPRFLSWTFSAAVLILVGALAPAVICLDAESRTRPRVILALFSMLALVLGIGYLRYFRYVPLFSSIGLVFAVAKFLPADSRLARSLTPDVAVVSRKYALILPGLILSAAIALYHLSVRTSQAAIPAGEVADSCDLSRLEPQPGWPAGAIVLSPPLIGGHLVALATGPRVVTIPNHPSAKGIERSYRFLDPSTADPRMYLDASRATHIAVCAWRGPPLPKLETNYPFAAALIEGKPPAWLRECPTDPSSPLRIYSYRNPDGSQAACPASAVSDQALP
ncbi:hypothetical protein EN817_18295 [Mesorhizobium sp. M3A.F.Ca.ET.174.01.1.1]|uniref:hypothetical protein n=1 Tax=unclassified Mesorhizobium TaxID=325217 RepID=UPI001093FF57|nr:MULTISPECIES: hypothetical protein [unclassified Mesorhizobium]TGS86114.1 hypothetical protein EN818_16150 [Mesorhizobium sp. M3A.F.Ca.ET.175.01.1.1]TGT24222.1 hypothetical protein EN817_18295 [Mesorhizobium sp. M3A.F.Ca.ET.174.01.1.1]